MPSGMALVTNFSLHATGWTDPEVDLPLTYSYYASNILLAADITSASLSVRWPMPVPHHPFCSLRPVPDDDCHAVIHLRS